MIRFSPFLPVLVLRKSQQSNWQVQHARSFAVKQLPWCSNSKQKLPSTTHATQGLQRRPIERFGIIAAMSNNSIIGLKGSIPWNVPADRKEFVRITRNKVLIVGRKTFEEQGNLSHISHAAKCIVISKSLDGESIQSITSTINTEVLIVRSFPEALDLARRLIDQETTSESDSTDDINCWIAGGQDIYYRAVLHPSAWIIHLTIIDIDLDVSSYAPSEIARFPPIYHWDHRFTKISEKVNTTQDGDAINFTQYVYKKLTFQ
jgi:dihydrofolate reductase